jgi:hypothetical protein
MRSLDLLLYKPQRDKGLRAAVGAASQTAPQQKVN